MIIGITGGIGCGKSTVLALFVRHGFSHIDSDTVVREKILKIPEIVSLVRKRMGDAVFNREGEIDRNSLAKAIFAHERERRWLESLIHPRLFSLWRAALMDAPPSKRWVIEVPLLFEKELASWFDLTVCVGASERQQLDRLSTRGFSEKSARTRIAAQMPLSEKLRRVDCVLWNEGSLVALEKQVERLLKYLG